MELIKSNEVTMTSQQIADLAESRHDSVKRTMMRLMETGAISNTPMVDGEKRRMVSLNQAISTRLVMTEPSGTPLFRFKQCIVQY